jgi:hypothetical protein
MSFQILYFVKKKKKKKKSEGYLTIFPMQITKKDLNKLLRLSYHFFVIILKKKKKIYELSL